MKKHKKLKIALIIILCVLAAAAGSCFALRAIRSHTEDGDGMVNQAAIASLDYSKSGDEYGRSTSIHLTDDGLLKYYRDDGTVGGSVQEVCRPAEDFVAALEEIIRRYDVRSWEELPAAELELLDGASATMTIEFADGLTIRLGDLYEMPDGAWAAVSEITGLCESCLRDSDNTVEVGREIQPADDSGLTLLVDYCEKTTGTVDGDGYSEIVLYQDASNGTWQLHTYSKYGDAEDEEHHAYQVAEDTVNEAFEWIADLKLAEYAGKGGTGSDGVEYVLKFRQDDTLLRVTAADIGDDGQSMLSWVGDVLYDVIPAAEDEHETYIED